MLRSLSGDRKNYAKVAQAGSTGCSFMLLHLTNAAIGTALYTLPEDWGDDAIGIVAVAPNEITLEKDLLCAKCFLFVGSALVLGVVYAACRFLFLQLFFRIF